MSDCLSLTVVLPDVRLKCSVGRNRLLHVSSVGPIDQKAGRTRSLFKKECRQDPLCTNNERGRKSMQSEEEDFAMKRRNSCVSAHMRLWGGTDCTHGA